MTEFSPFACYNHDVKHKFGSVGRPVEISKLKFSMKATGSGRWASAVRFASGNIVEELPQSAGGKILKPILREKE